MTVIVLIGLFLRVWVVTAFSSASPIGDELTYLKGSQSFGSGKLYRETRAPGYSAFIALTLTVAPAPPPDDPVRRFDLAGKEISISARDLTIARMGNVALGVCSILLVWLMGRTLFAPATGVLAAAWLSVHPRHVSFPLYLAAEHLYTASIMAGVLLAIGSIRSSVLLWSFGSGFALGIAALARDMAMYFVVVAAGLIYWLSRDGRVIALQRAAALVVGAAVAILPWTERNYSVYGQFIPIGFSEGIPLFEGNYRDQEYVLEERSRLEQRYIVDWGMQAPERQSSRFVPEANYAGVYANARLKEDAWQAIRERQPTWILEKLIENGPRLICPLVNFPLPWELAPASFEAGTRDLHTFAFLPMHALLLLLAPLGVASWRLRSREVLPLAFLLLSFAIHIVANAGISRFQYPYEWVVVLMAATFCTRGLPRTRGRVGWALVLLALVLSSQLLIPQSWLQPTAWVPAR